MEKAKSNGHQITSDYEKGFEDAFDVIADYVEEEVCIITASMIRRMKYEKWRFDKKIEEDPPTE